MRRSTLSLLGQGVRDGIEVYVSYINEQGGVNGRKIEFIAEDDGYEPMRTVAAAKKLAEQDKVVNGYYHAKLAVMNMGPLLKFEWVIYSHIYQL